MIEHPRLGWISMANVPALVEQRLGIRAEDVARFLRRSVEMYTFAHPGYTVIRERSVAEIISNDEFLLSHRVSHWDNRNEQWSFRKRHFPSDLPIHERLTKGMERQQDDDQIRVYDWAACAVDWQKGTVANWDGFRSNIEIDWRNVAVWIKKLIHSGLLSQEVIAIGQTRGAGPDRRPRPTPQALVRWFVRRKAKWYAGRRFPDEGTDWQAAVAYFQHPVYRPHFRHARKVGTVNKDGTASGWVTQGPRKQSRPFPFVDLIRSQIGSS